MTFDRVPIVESALDAFLASAPDDRPRLPADAELRAGSGLTGRAAVALFEDQVTSRAVDVAARELKKTNRSYYTIGSAGHEDNAVLGAQLRITDPAFLHYRSGGFFMARLLRSVRATMLSEALPRVLAEIE